MGWVIQEKGLFIRCQSEKLAKGTTDFTWNVFDAVLLHYFESWKKPMAITSDTIKVGRSKKSSISKSKESIKHKQKIRL